MKNKRTSYFMLPIVLSIWAVIGWKVYAMMKSDQPALPLSQEAGGSKQEAVSVPDTFELLANYRDPFLDEISIVARTADCSLPTAYHPVKKDTIPVKSRLFPKMSYFGLVKQSGDEKAVGFLNVNGKSNFVKGGEQIGEIAVGRIWKDSVEVMMGKERRVVRK